ncbi:CsbD family protein [Nocardioides sp.]|uniref:CsbD family protein n=1 Tax=Nocardioides sp. TaxID=35761 RepID=UPI00260FC22E|nr:CsbD family protein [Nocardioides sp.]
MGADDKLENKGQDLKGRAKEALGAATDNDRLKNEGKADQAKASLKDKAESVKDKVTEGIDKLL